MERDEKRIQRKLFFPNIKLTPQNKSKNKTIQKRI